MLQQLATTFGPLGALGALVALFVLGFAWMTAIAQVMLRTSSSAIKVGVVALLTLAPPLSLVVWGQMFYRIRKRRQRFAQEQARTQRARTEPATSSLGVPAQPAGVLSEV